MHDARTGETVWESLGTDSPWRECLSKAIDGNNECFYTLQPLDSSSKKPQCKLRSYDFSGELIYERVFKSDFTEIGPDSFIVSGGNLYLWKYCFRDDVFFAGHQGEGVPCTITNLDHEELRRYDPDTGKFVRLAFSYDWCEESVSHHFDYCNGGIVVLARHGPIVLERKLEGGAPLYGQKADGNAIFRVGHDGSISEIIREPDTNAMRLELVEGWSGKYFAAQMCNGDMRIYDKDCREVQYLKLSQTHSDFAREWLGRKYEWADDVTIVCRNTLSKNKEKPVLAIDARTGSVRQARPGDFPTLQCSGVRLKGALKLKERF